MTALNFPNSPVNGQTYEGYTYNATKGVWEINVVQPSLAGLTDSTITTPSTGQLLRYNGTKWVNHTPALNTLSDVVTTTPAVGDSLTWNGSDWVNGPRSGNAIINGDFRIWQRGTSFTTGAPSSGQYTADRWVPFSPATAQHTFSRQTAGLTGFQYCMRAQRNSGSTATNIYSVYQFLETADSLIFAGKTVTLSFWARAGSNWSSSLLSATIASGTGIDENFILGATGYSQNVGNVTLTTSWQRFSVSRLLPSNITQLSVIFSANPTGTAGSNDYFEITGVQLEAGPVATPFRLAGGGSKAAELALCQRYYWRATGALFSQIGNGSAATTTGARISVPLPVSMRRQPISIEFSNLVLFDGVNIPAVIAVVADGGGADQVNPNNIRLDVGGSGYTAFRPYAMMTNNNTNGFLAVNAEL